MLTLIGNLTLAIVRVKPNPIIYSVVVLFIAYYAMFGYNKPHGNLLRYVMLFFALGEIVILFFHNGMGSNNISIGLHVLAISIIVYVAGRLNKVKQNCVLIPLAFALFIASVIITLPGVQTPPTDMPIDIESATSATAELPPEMPEMLQSVFERIVSGFTSFSNAIVCWVLGTAYFLRYRQHKAAGLDDKPVEETNN